MPITRTIAMNISKEKILGPQVDYPQQNTLGQHIVEIEYHFKQSYLNILTNINI